MDYLLPEPEVEDNMAQKTITKTQLKQMIQEVLAEQTDSIGSTDSLKTKYKIALMHASDLIEAIDDIWHEERTSGTGNYSKIEDLSHRVRRVSAVLKLCNPEK